MDKNVFFFGGRGSNSGPYILYALSLPTGLNSRGRIKIYLKEYYETCK